MSYDTKCLQLARDFLRDEPAINDENHAHELAQEIQSTIEDFMHFYALALGAKALLAMPKDAPMRAAAEKVLGMTIEEWAALPVAINEVR